jgi:hypothetical protein
MGYSAAAEQSPLLVVLLSALGASGVNDFPAPTVVEVIGI